MHEGIDGAAAEPLAGDSEGVALASDPGKPLSIPPLYEGEVLWRGEQDGPMPMRSLLFRPSVPDLRLIDSALWREVLAALPRRPRIDAALGPGLGASGAFELALSLPPAPSEYARKALVQGPSLPLPELRRPNPSRQVNVRLRPDEHEALRVAAELLGLTPTQVARMCILTGVRRAIADHDAALARIGLDQPRNEPPASVEGPATAPAAFNRSTSSAE